MNTCSATEADFDDPPRMWKVHEPEPWSLSMRWEVEAPKHLNVKRTMPVRVCSKCHCLYIEYGADDPKERE